MCHIKCQSCQASSINQEKLDLTDSESLTCPQCNYRNEAAYVNEAVSCTNKTNEFLTKTSRQLLTNSDQCEKITHQALGLINQCENYYNLNENVLCVQLFELLTECYISGGDYKKAVEVSSTHLLNSYR
jgi:hypothetical protein